MKASWVSGIEEELQVDIRQNFKESLVMRKRLVEMLLEKAGESKRVARSKALYDNPNWAYLQADQRGYERAMHEIIDLIYENSSAL